MYVKEDGPRVFYTHHRDIFHGVKRYVSEKLFPYLNNMLVKK